MKNSIRLAVLFSSIVGNVIAMDTPENAQTKKLCQAIQCDDRKEFDTLLKAGVNRLIPYRYDVNGTTMVRTPIIIAILFYRFEMGKQLLEQDADKQINGSEGSPLMNYVAMKGAYEFIPLLMSKGAQINDCVFAILSNTTFTTPERRAKTLLVLKRYTQKKGKGD